MADKYLNEVFDIEKEVTSFGNKIFLIAGVGAGKSKFVTEYLASKGAVLFVTSRKAKVEADIANSTFTNTYCEHFSNNQLLVTNAKLASMIHNISNNQLREIDEFLDHFDYIVVDEVHSLASDSIFAHSTGSVLSFVEYAADKGKVIIAMTGTPEPIEHYFQEHGWSIRDYTHKCRYVHPQKVRIIFEKHVQEIIDRNLGKTKIVYFANKTDSIINKTRYLLEERDVAPENISIIVSRYRVDEFMDSLKRFRQVEGEVIGAASEITYNSIVTKECIPDSCHIMFSTSTLKEGMNLNNDEIVMICENHLLSNLIQYWGRARMQNCQVYVIADAEDHPSKMNELVYEFDCLKEEHATNAFMQERILNPQNPMSTLEKEKFVKYVEGTNPYLYFDFISNTFKTFHIKLREEKRIAASKKWKAALLGHCDRYDIDWSDLTDSYWYQDLLLTLAKKQQRFFVEDKQLLTIESFLFFGYGIKYKKVEQINKELERLNAPFVICKKKETKKPNRNKWYWQFELRTE